MLTLIKSIYGLVKEECFWFKENIHKITLETELDNNPQGGIKTKYDLSLSIIPSK